MGTALERLSAGSAARKEDKEKRAMLKIQMFIHKLMNPLANNEGASAVEYGIMVALIAAVIVGVVGTIGESLLDAFTKVSNAILPAG
jgi:pilus assembly protein Flp/PilA